MIFILGSIITMAPIVTAGLAGIAAAFNAINWPIVLIIGAIAAFIAAGLYMWDNWDAITQNLSSAFTKVKNGVIQSIILMIKSVTGLGVAISESLGIEILKKGVDSVVGSLEAMMSPIPEVKASFGSFGDAVKSLKDTMVPDVKEVEKETTTSMKTIATETNKASAALVSLGGRTRNIEPLSPLVVKSAEDVSMALVETDETAKVVSESIGASIGAVKDGFSDLWVTAEQIGGAMSNAMQNAAANIAISFAEMAASAITGGQGFQNFGAMILESISQFMSQFGKALITMAAGMIAVQTMGANPLVALAAGIALVAGGAIIKNLTSKGADTSAPAFANGGLVFGPTMGLVGEGSGTSMSNPEVIAPLDKLKSFIQPQGGVTDNITVAGILRGEDIHISNQIASLQYANLVK